MGNEALLRYFRDIVQWTVVVHEAFLFHFSGVVVMLVVLLLHATFGVGGCDADVFYRGRCIGLVSCMTMMVCIVRLGRGIDWTPSRYQVGKF